MRNGNVRVGIIGYGYWGPNLTRNMAALDDVDLIAVADMNEERLRQFQTKFPDVKCVTNYRDLFEMNLDAVVVATPPATHFNIASDCLRHGLHVMVEKPLTLRSADAQELNDLADERGLTLMVGNTFEYNPAVNTLKQIIDEGELGDIYYVNAVRTNLGLYQPNVNAMWDLAPHDISILLYLLGKEPVSVSTQGGAAVFPHIHDLVYLHLKFPNRVLAHIHVSWLDPVKVRRVTVVGSKKMAVYDDIEPVEKVRIYDRGVDAPPYTDSFQEFQCSYRYGEAVAPVIPCEEPLRVECQHFIDSIRTSTRPRSDGVVGLRIVKILEAATTSLENDGRPYSVMPTVVKSVPQLEHRAWRAAASAAGQ